MFEGNASTPMCRMLNRLGYAQELRRRMGGFSNFAISMSTICILAGGVTSFHLGFCSVGGAAIGLGWPLVALFSLVVATTMGQVASAFPTAGGLYHWASILGGRGWGWVTAWFNLAGLVTVLAAINVGTCAFALGTLGPRFGYDPEEPAPGSAFFAQAIGVLLITGSQALINHLGIRLTTALTDLSGYLILVVALGLVGGDARVRAAARADAPGPPDQLQRRGRRRGLAGDRGPRAGSSSWGSCSPPTRSPASTPRRTRPRRRSGRPRTSRAAWSARSPSRAWPAGSCSRPSCWRSRTSTQAAAQGEGAFAWIMRTVLPPGLALAFNVGIALAQYGCGLATVTSASRMAFAFARDGGLPGSRAWRWVCPTRKTPVVAIWGVAALVRALHAQHPRLRHDHGGLHDLPLRLVHAPHGPRRLGLRPDLDDDGTLGPRPLVSPAGVRQRARLRPAHRRRHAAALRPGRHDRGRLAGRPGGRLVRLRAPPLPGTASGQVSFRKR